MEDAFAIVDSGGEKGTDEGSYSSLMFKLVLI